MTVHLRCAILDRMLRRWFILATVLLLLLGLHYTPRIKDSNSDSWILKSSSKSLAPFPPGYTKKRLLITTDIGGGDKDDTQSMIHFLLYSDMFDLEGIVVGRPKGHISEMMKVWRAYRRDYRNLSFHSADYITPGKLRRLIRMGASRGGRTPSVGYSHPTSGSRLIVKAAKRNDPRPLYIVSWGSVTDVAQAIHDKPSIKKKIKLFAIANHHKSMYNTLNDPAPYKYLLKQQGLHWIAGTSAPRGIYLTGMYSKKRYGNVGFVKKVVRKHGHLGKLYYQISAPIDVNKYGIKMTDTASVFFVMNGDFDDPSKPSWGGTYCREKKDFYVDCKDAPKIGNIPGAWSVAIHRRAFLKHWEKRMKRLDPIK